MTPPIVQFGRYREVAEQVAARIAQPRLALPMAARFASHGAEVTVASRGVAESIAVRLLEIFPEGFSGVTLQTVESLAQRVLNAAGQFPRVADDAERRLIMRSARGRLSDPMLDTRGIPSMLERSYRDVRDNGLTLSEFQKRVRARKVYNRPRLDVFLSVWKEYERLIATIGAIDPADLLTRAAELVGQKPDLAGRQIIAGFYDLTGAQEAFLSALARAGRVESIHVPVPAVSGPYRFTSRFVEFLGSIGVPAEPLLRARGDEPSPPSPAIDIVEESTREDELRRTCRSIRALIDRGVAPHEIGVVGRSLDPWDATLLDRFAQQSGFHVVHRAGAWLRSHRIGRALALMIRLPEENYSRGHVIEIFRCGLRLTTRTNARSFDQATRVCGIAGGTGPEVRRAHVRSGWATTIEEYAAAVSELEMLIAPVTQAAGGEQWAAWLSRVVGMFPLETDLDLAAADEVQRIIRMLRRADATRLRFDGGTILDVLEQPELPPVVSAPAAVWYGDVMKMRGRTFRHLFAIRMQDDLFPQRRNEDPLLRDRDRRILEIPEVGNGRDEEQLLLQLILDSSTESVHFSFASTDGLGKVLRPSQLVKNLALAEDAGNAALILNNFSKYLAGRKAEAEETPGEGIQPHEASAPPRSPRLERQLQLVARAGSASPFDGHLSAGERIDRAVAESLARISPTQLEEFGECPQKFLLKTILGVKEIDDPEREVQINIRDKGSIDHRILERFYRQVTDAGLWDEILRATADAAALRAGHVADALSPDLASRLDTIIEEEFAKFAEEHPPFNPTLRDMERRNTIANLHAFVAGDLRELGAAGLVPRHFEWRFGPRHREGVVIDNPEPLTLSAETVSLSISGSIDRIDRGSEAWRILDYKSGKGKRHESIGEKIDRGLKMQLPLYAMAVAHFFHVESKNISAAIKPLAATDTKAESFAFTLADKESSLRSVLSLFIRAISERVFPAVPSGGFDGACKYCPVNLSCRTLHDTEERYAMGRIGDPRLLLEQREAQR